MGVRIDMLGGLRIVRGRETIERAPTHKVGALLAYLAYHRQPQPRERLAEALWPDRPPANSRNSLNNALTKLRAVLEPPSARGSIVRSTRAHVGLAPEVTTDVEELTAALSARLRSAPGQGSLLASLEVARGELLPGHYEDWVHEARERLRHLALSAIRLELEEGALPRAEAVALARRAVELDPLSEESHRQLIRLHLEGGDRAAAARCYEALEEVLERELGVEPDPETRALLDGASAPGTGTGRAHALEPTLRPIRLPAAPRPPTRLFGRQRELEAIRRAVIEERAPLLTLTGPGGVGKTRLAVEAARRLEEVHPGGVAFVPLVGLERGDELGAALAAGLGAGAASGDPLAALARGLAERPPILVLDNAEHLLGSGLVAALDALLDRLPGVRVVITSRSRIRVPGERELPVGPLDVPGPRDGPDDAETPAEALFWDRARARVPGLAASEADRATVRELVRRLDGLPLALELAAGRMAALGPQAMLDRLGERFTWLATRDEGVPARHRSLEAAIDWSYDLLRDDVRRAARGLAVFEGAFTVRDASCLLDADGLEPVEALLDHSLLVAARGPEGDGERYVAMLGSVRELLLERMVEPEREALRRRHLAWCLELARGRPAGASAAARRARLALSADDLRAALRFGLDAGAEDALALCDALGSTWLAAGWYAEGQAFCERARRAAGGSALLRARVGVSAGAFAMGRGAYREAVDLLSEGAAALEAAGASPVDVSIAKRNRGSALIALGRYDDAGAAAEDALDLARAAGDLRAEASCLAVLGRQRLLLGRLTESSACFERSVALLEDLGAPGRLAYDRRCLAWVRHALGDAASADRLLDEGIRGAEAVGDASGAAFGRVDRALIRLDRDAPPDDIEPELLEAARAFRRLEQGGCSGTPQALRALGLVAARRGDLVDARRRLEQGLARLRRQGAAGLVGPLLVALGHEARLRGDLDRARTLLDEALAGCALRGEPLLAIEALEEWASVLLAGPRAADAEEAAHALGAARALRRTTRAHLQPRSARLWEDAEAAARAALGEDGLRAALGRGAWSGWPPSGAVGPAGEDE